MIMEARGKIYNGNWAEWSAIWSEIIHVISKFDLKSQVWSQTKISRHEVQLPLCYSHLEIAEFRQHQYVIDQVPGLSKRGNKNSFISQKWCIIERKWCDLEQKWRDLGHEWRDLQQTWFRSKNSVIRELIKLLTANQIAWITSDFKMDIINILTP